MPSLIQRYNFFKSRLLSEKLIYYSIACNLFQILTYVLETSEIDNYLLKWEILLTIFDEHLVHLCQKFIGWAWALIIGINFNRTYNYSVSLIYQNLNVLCDNRFITLQRYKWQQLA